jgi:hypothetical protein
MSESNHEWVEARQGLGAVAKQLELDGDASHQGEQDSGGDEAHRGLDGRALGKPETAQQRSQVTDVARGLLVNKADICSWRECDVCIPYAAISANKRHIQKRHENFIVARGSRDSDIWSGTCSNGSQMSESNHERPFGTALGR